ncbi:hypothetical protein LCGC14_1068970 [marine sediment metagenome]|uniref:Uncharacterized protein n=1 Tax=marine sediment metagenome TaxID=412755 RepID=A0A0F9N5W6_9ZZZZ
MNHTYVQCRLQVMDGDAKIMFLGFGETKAEARKTAVARAEKKGYSVPRDAEYEYDIRRGKRQ